MNFCRIAAMYLCASLSVFFVACGQASFAPTSPSTVPGRGGNATSGAVISGTVAGTALPQTSSSDHATTLATGPVTVTVVGTSISTTVDGSGRFQLTNVPAGDVQLKFTATGLDATLTVRDVQAGDRIDIRVAISDRSIRIEAERRERNGRDGNGRDDDDDDDDDDDEDDEDDDDEFKGLVAGLTGTCPVVTFTLNGRTVKTTTATRYEDGTCASVQNNARIEVHGRRQADGAIQADKIEIED